MLLSNPSQVSAEELKSGFALVTRVITGCGGEITLSESEKTIINGEAISLGGNSAMKKNVLAWFPAKEMAFRVTRQKQFDTLLEKYGISWGGVSLVPLALLDELRSQLSSIISGFEMDLDHLCSRYYMVLAKHKQSQPEQIRALIDKYALSKDAFRTKFKLQMPQPSIFNPVSEDGVAEDLQSTLIREIADNAAQIRSKILGKDKIDCRTIPTIKALADKLKNFVILNPAFGLLGAEFTVIAENLPSKGSVSGSSVAALQGYITLLSSEDAVHDYINGKKEAHAESAMAKLDGFDELDPSSADVKIKPLASNEEQLKLNDLDVIEPAPIKQAVEIITPTNDTPSSSLSDLSDDEWGAFGFN